MITDPEQLFSQLISTFNILPNKKSSNILISGNFLYITPFITTLTKHKLKVTAIAQKPIGEIIKSLNVSEPSLIIDFNGYFASNLFKLFDKKYLNNVWSIIICSEKAVQLYKDAINKNSINIFPPIISLANSYAKKDIDEAIGNNMTAPLDAFLRLKKGVTLDYTGTAGIIGFNTLGQNLALKLKYSTLISSIIIYDENEYRRKRAIVGYNFNASSDIANVLEKCDIIFWIDENVISTQTHLGKIKNLTTIVPYKYVKNQILKILPPISSNNPESSHENNANSPWRLDNRNYTHDGITKNFSLVYVDSNTSTNNPTNPELALLGLIFLVVDKICVDQNKLQSHNIHEINDEFEEPISEFFY